MFIFTQNVSYYTDIIGGLDNTYKMTIKPKGSRQAQKLMTLCGQNVQAQFYEYIFSSIFLNFLKFDNVDDHIYNFQGIDCNITKA